MKKKLMTERQQYWLTHIEAALRSGEPLQHYAKRQGVSIGALYNAKSVFKRAGLLKGFSVQRAADAFVPVQVVTPRSVPIRCQLQHRGGWQLTLERLPDPRWLRELVGDRDAAA